MFETFFMRFYFNNTSQNVSLKTLKQNKTLRLIISYTDTTKI